MTLDRAGERASQSSHPIFLFKQSFAKAKETKNKNFGAFGTLFFHCALHNNTFYTKQEQGGSLRGSFIRLSPESMTLKGSTFPYL